MTPVPPITPVGAWPYFDTVAVWLRRRADGAALSELRSHSAHVRVENWRARFDAEFRQRIVLTRPDKVALSWIAARKDAFINRLDVALDHVFASTRERNRAYDFVDAHLVRRWHGKKQPIFVHPGTRQTRYDAPRRAKSKTVLYQEPFSRVTGEADCCRIEWRANGIRGVRATGVREAVDLLKFDHREFWRERLILYEADPDRIGRYLRNRADGGRSRAVVPEDRRRAHVLISTVDNVQELLDRYRSRFRIDRLLRRIDATHLLPSAL